MAKTRRKMLGRVDSAECIALMRLIETQSKATIGKWAVGYAKENYLPLYEAIGAEKCFSQAVRACEEYLAGGMKLTDLKTALKAAREGAAKAVDPVAQAAARAVATGCSAVTTPTSALGFLFYGAAATAYATAGLEADEDKYDALAAQELARALESLRAAAVENEPNPAKINWNC